MRPRDICPHLPAKEERKPFGIYLLSTVLFLLLSHLSLFSPPVFSRAADESFCPAPISSPFLRLRDGLTEHRKEEAVIKGESWPAGSGTGSVRWTINVGEKLLLYN